MASGLWRPVAIKAVIVLWSKQFFFCEIRVASGRAYSINDSRRTLMYGGNCPVSTCASMENLCMHPWRNGCQTDDDDGGGLLLCKFACKI